MEITIDDIYAVVGIIPGLTEAGVPEIWEEINTDGGDVVYYKSACSATVNSFVCEDDYEYFS